MRGTSPSNTKNETALTTQMLYVEGSCKKQLFCKRRCEEHQELLPFCENVWTFVQVTMLRCDSSSYGCAQPLWKWSERPMHWIISEAARGCLKHQPLISQSTAVYSQPKKQKVIRSYLICFLAGGKSPFFCFRVCATWSIWQQPTISEWIYTCLSLWKIIAVHATEQLHTSRKYTQKNNCVLLLPDCLSRAIESFFSAAFLLFNNGCETVSRRTVRPKQQMRKVNLQTWAHPQETRNARKGLKCLSWHLDQPLVRSVWCPGVLLCCLCTL